MSGGLFSMSNKIPAIQFKPHMATVYTNNLKAVKFRFHWMSKLHLLQYCFCDLFIL